MARVNDHYLKLRASYLFSETGELNTLVHLWAYEDAADRTKRRAAMQADPAWKEYLKRNAEALVERGLPRALLPVFIDQVDGLLPYLDRARHRAQRGLDARRGEFPDSQKQEEGQ